MAGHHIFLVVDDEGLAAVGDVISACAKQDHLSCAASVHPDLVSLWGLIGCSKGGIANNYEFLAS